MAKEFNITGTCIPSRHYMADTSEKLRQIMALVEKGRYFTINRPRQYGKTTTLSLLDRRLLDAGYLSVWMSFEGSEGRETDLCGLGLKLSKSSTSKI